jgi:ATP-dependent DNA helicase RecQ
MSRIILREFQQRAIEALFNHRHLILVSPTGSGKSLVFQKFIELNREQARVIFISPLNALARQQAKRFEENGIKVWTSVGQSQTDLPDGPGVWVLNPEKLAKQAWRHLHQFRPDFLVVDEAHCIWEWGDGFRPEFKIILELIEKFKIKRSLWCTATLPPAAKAQLSKHLPESHILLGEFALPEQLTIERRRSAIHHRFLALQNLLQTHANEAGIIFVSTRSSAEKLAQYLEFWKRPHVVYHAGMSQEERFALEKKLESDLIMSEPWVVIATSAFGMGMDYPFLKFCVLFDPAFSLLSLAQSLGRVGRANEPAQAYVFWHEDDFKKLDWFIQGKPERARELGRVLEWCKTHDCHRQYLENYFNASRS